jgi:hypothetical protein
LLMAINFVVLSINVIFPGYFLSNAMFANV